MKIILTIALLISVCHLHAQKDTLYYAEDGNKTSVDKASQYEVITIDGTGRYWFRTYQSKTNRLLNHGSFTDSSRTKFIGPAVYYYESGNIKDSSIYDVNGERSHAFHFYESGKLNYKADKDVFGKWSETALDENGAPLTNYIYEREASFKGGSDAWVKFLSANATTSFKNIKRNTPPITVVVQFIVNSDGSIVNPKIFQSSGRKDLDDDAIRIIMQSPKWLPAIQYNRPVKAYRRQPITYSF